jgi:hypothetical protein
MGKRTRLLFACGFVFTSIATPLRRRAAVQAFTFTSRTVCGKYRRRHARCYEYCFLPARATHIVDTVSPLSVSDEFSSKVVLRHPRIAQQISFVRSTEEWLRQYLSLSESQQQQMYARWPNGIDCIRRLGRQRLHTWLKFFLSDMVGLNIKQLRKMIVMRPKLLSYTLSNVQATTTYFRRELGLSSNEYASLLQSYPSVLMHSIDNRLRPTVDFLQNDCGGGKDNWSAWKRVVYCYPNIFSHSLEKTLLPKVKFLCNRGDEKSLGLKRSELSQLVAKFPPILWLSEDNLQSKLDFLNESLDLNGSELKTIIVSYPQVLGLSLQNNLQPKVDFFLDGSAKSTGDHHFSNCGLSKNQLKEFVLYQPALLAYSLENRLRPRISRMQEKNIFL